MVIFMDIKVSSIVISSLVYTEVETTDPEIFGSERQVCQNDRVLRKLGDASRALDKEENVCETR